jgi:hypothetical protein
MPFLSALLLISTAWATPNTETTPTETHSFHVVGKVKYRCYAGHSGKKAVDELTKASCDNKDYQSTLIDKVVTVAIQDEPDPESSPELAGFWGGKFEFKGRQFEIGMTLFKDSVAPLYRLRLAADDNQPTSRRSATFTEMKTLKEMNPLAVVYSSAGKKEEISFWVEVRPAGAK